MEGGKSKDKVVISLSFNSQIPQWKAEGRKWFKGLYRTLYLWFPDFVAKRIMQNADVKHRIGTVEWFWWKNSNLAVLVLFGNLFFSEKEFLIF